MTWTRCTLWTLTAAAVLTMALWNESGAPPAPELLATVDGVPLTELDLHLKLRRDHAQQQQAEEPPEYRRKVLETIIGQELAARKAVKLGLDADPQFKKELAPLEAQLNAYRRKALAELLAKHAIAQKGGVSDAEARAFYEKNAAQLKTQVQVLQILRRTRESIELARAELLTAPSFEAYMRSQFAALPESERPWDLGFLRWQQLPEQWREVVYGMKKGEISRVIAGPKDRFWILQVVDTRQDPAVTFETVKPTLIEALKRSRELELEAKTQRELRETARVVYVRAP